MQSRPNSKAIAESVAHKGFFAQRPTPPFVHPLLHLEAPSTSSAGNTDHSGKRINLSILQPVDEL